MTTKVIYLLLGAAIAFTAGSATWARHEGNWLDAFFSLGWALLLAIVALGVVRSDDNP